MKIGIFGDSFCEKKPIPNQPSWFELLKRHGHEVTSFGEGGSSVLYSACLIEKHAKDFDLLIWGVTSPTRLSITISEKPHILHFPTIDAHNAKNFKKEETVLKINAVTDYFKYLMDFEEQDLVASALINHLMAKYNLMIVPCFLDPLKPEFNLFDLCAREIDYYFPGITHDDFFQNYIDLRRCHLSLENNKILSDIIADNLRSGIFQTSYDNFVNPGADKEFYFDKK